MPVCSSTPPSPTTQCDQPVTLPSSSSAASRHWKDCGRNMPCAMSSSRVQISFTGRFTSFAMQRRLGGVVAERAPAEAAAHVALVERHLLGLEPERLGDRLARDVGRLRAFPDLDVVARGVEARHRVERLHLRVVAVVAAELGLVRLRRRGERGLGVALRVERLRLRRRVGVHLRRSPRSAASESKPAGVRLVPRHLERVARRHRVRRSCRRPPPRRRAVAPCRCTPFIAFIFASFQLSGAPPCTGECRAVAYTMPGRLHVDRVLRRAVHLERHVAPRHRLADQPELVLGPSVPSCSTAGSGEGTFANAAISP